MTNELYEYLRVLVYPVGAAGLMYLSLSKTATPAVLRAMAVYFLMWGMLLVLQHYDAAHYRYVANLVSTPVLFGIVAVIWWTFWKLRKMP